MEPILRILIINGERHVIDIAPLIAGNVNSISISDPGWRERRIARLIHSCLYRGSAVETGCNCRRHCYAGKGEDGLVRVEDCRACVGTLAIEDNRPNSHPDPSKV